MFSRTCLGLNPLIASVYLMMISKTMTLNINVVLEKGIDFMKVIIFYVGMVAGAVLLEQVVDATNIMRIEGIVSGSVRY